MLSLPRLAAILALALLFAGSLPSPASAEERLRSNAPEAWAMFWFISATQNSAVGTPKHREPWSVELFLDLGHLPHLGVDDRRVGFGGTKVEDLNQSPVFGRPGLLIGLPWSVALSVGYVPPVELFGARAHLFAIALERPLFETGPWTIGARLHTQFGKVRGDFTCPKRVTAFEPGSEGNPYGCDTKSNDSALQRSVGLEFSGSYRIEALGGLAPYLSLGANYLNGEFQVHAEVFGGPDRTHLGADTFTFSVGLGASYPLSERLEIGLGLFYVPLYVLRPPREIYEEKDALVQARAELVWALR